MTSLLSRAQYFAPESIAEALQIRSRMAVEPIAGGTIALAVDRRAMHSDHAVMDLTRLGLDSYERDGETVRLGSMVTYRTILDRTDLRDTVPLLARMASGVTGGPQLRNRATFGGSLCFANPASEAPACAVALDATTVIASPMGERRVPAADFLLGPFRTALRSDELLVAVDIPVRNSVLASGYLKIKISESSWPLATAAAVATDAGTRLAVGAVAGVPLLIELPADPKDVDEADVRHEVVRLGEDSGWWGDELASASYRSQIAHVAAWRALRQVVVGLEERV